MTNKPNYATLFDRIKAVFVDVIILFISMIVLTQVFSFFEVENTVYRIIAFVFIFILYEPILVSFFKGTIGHKAMGIQIVSRRDQEGKINLLFAIVRFIVKSFLGWISLLTISTDKENRALHDMAVGSIAIAKK